MGRGPWLHFAGIALALFSAGCCASYDGFRDSQKRVVARNRARWDRALRRTTELLGAELLTVEAERFDLPAWCASSVFPGLEPSSGCRTGESAEGRVVNVTTPKREARSLILFRSTDWRHGRLARRGNDFFVLVPDPSRRKIGQGSRCECQGEGYGYSLPEPTHTGFVVASMPIREVHEVRVPLTVDFIDWTCSVTVMAGKGCGHGVAME